MVKNPWKIGKIPMDFSINFHQLAITLDRGLATFWSWTQSWTSEMDDMGKNDSIPLDMLDGYGWFDMENPMENPKKSKWMRTGGSPMTIMTQEASKCNIMQECSTSSKHIWRSEMTIILVLFHAWNGQSECMFSTNINIESTSNLISGTSRRIWFPQSPLRSILRLASTGSLGLSNSLSLIVTWCCSTCISVCWCLLIFLGFANRKACPREAGYVNVTCQRDVFFFSGLAVVFHQWQILSISIRQANTAFSCRWPHPGCADPGGSEGVGPQHIFGIVWMFLLRFGCSICSSPHDQFKTIRVSEANRRASCGIAQRGPEPWSSLLRRPRPRTAILPAVSWNAT